MNRDLTRGPVMKSMLLFAIPMILGDLLQQCYNIADTLIVGQFLGRNALAAVGSAFTLMTFLTSIILGLCMGSGALFSMRFGQRDEKALCENLCASFFFIALVGAFECSDIHLSGWAPHLPPGSRRGVGQYARIPVCDFHGHSRRFPL